jgi:RNA polymerase sigma-70 factor (ECF subfamily)
VTEAAADRARREFEELVLEHLGSLHGFALTLTRNAADAEDLVQDAVVRAYRFFHRFERGTNVRAWLFRIVRNTFINAYRKRRARPAESRFEAIAGAYEQLIDETRVLRLPNPEEALSDALVLDDVRRGLDDMPEEYRAVVHLCLLEGFSYRETAEALDVPVGTVMSRLHRGRKRLQAALLEHARHRGLAPPEPPAEAEGERPNGDPS